VDFIPIFVVKMSMDSFQDWQIVPHKKKALHLDRLTFFGWSSKLDV
jgi:hypothetical protein